MIGSTITLPDGRALGYAEWGDPDGEPMLFFHGTPGSRLTRPVPAPPGAHVLSIERPGHGLSSPLPGRTLLDWPADVRVMLDALGLDRVYVQGVSGGGPWAAVCAHALGERIRAVALVETAGDAAHVDVTSGMNEQNEMLFVLARDDPEQLRAGLEMMAASLAEATPEDVRLMMGGEEASDDLVVMLLESALGAFAQGVDGVIDDLALFVAPWGFDASEIAVPTIVAHGTEDTNVPFRNGEWLAATIPGATFLRYEGETHTSLLVNHGDAITKALLALD